MYIYPRMRAYVCMFVYLCICVYVCVYARVCVFVRIRLYTCVFVRICVHMRAYVCTKRSHERFELAFLTTPSPPGAETLTIITKSMRLALPYRIL